MAGRALTSTYRLQLNRDFRFADALSLVPYLDRLGISHIYSSPILAARLGSTHGYDVVDPKRLNPELGSETEWRELVDALHERGMGLVLDIVPNHMATGHQNPYWDDVLTYGRASRYAHWFDIDWSPPQRSLRDRVLLPVLGNELDAVLARGELSVVREGERFRLRYFGNTFPVAPGTEGLLREPGRGTRDSAAAGPTPDSRIPTPEFLHSQHYQLAFWRRAAREINYRRFFDINELVCLRVEDPEVFADTHARILDWVGDGSLDGLRIDHIDGLFDPRGYLERLRAAVEERRKAFPTPEPFPIVVEKILSPGEELRAAWPIQGTTGYEFLNDLKDLFVDPDGGDALEGVYRDFVRIRNPALAFPEVSLRGKLSILRGPLAADVARLTRLLAPLARRDPRGAGLSRAALAEGIVQFIACLPVYRTYVDGHSATVDPADRGVIGRALAWAKARAAAQPAVLDLIADLLLQPDGGANEVRDDSRTHRLHFIGRFQQTSGPATAKGVEDTALYRYVPLLSLNEVGGEPGWPLEAAVDRLHRGNLERARRWPSQLLSTSTHDTKRSADVRGRLNVLSEIPGLWAEHVARWRGRNRKFKSRVRGRLAPDANTEYLLYQTLLGIWPLAVPPNPAHELPEAAILAELRERVGAYMLKAVREAKAQTSWTDPDPKWEGALSNFVNSLLSADAASPFLLDLAWLAGRITRPGLWNSLSRVLIHLAVPGTPDLYQGDELWNLSLVDPDNRRPVNFGLRDRLLREVVFRSGAGAQERQCYLRELLETPEDGRIKLYVTWCVLQARRSTRALFARGSYEPMAAEGERAPNVFAFLRRGEGRVALVVAPRLAALLGASTTPPVDAAVWGDTVLRLPAELGASRWRCALSGKVLESGSANGTPTLRLADMLDILPIALTVTSEV